MPLSLVPSPRTPADLCARRAAAEDAVRVVVEAPVRHVPAALLEALQGSWGTPQEVLGETAVVHRVAAAL